MQKKKTIAQLTGSLATCLCAPERNKKQQSRHYAISIQTLCTATQSAGSTFLARSRVKMAKSEIIKVNESAMKKPFEVKAARARVDDRRPDLSIFITVAKVSL